MDGFTSDTQGESFVVATFEDFEFDGGEQVQVLQEVEEAFVFFVDAKKRGGIASAQFREKNAALLAELRDAATERNAVGTGFVSGEPLEEQGFDFGRNGVLHPLSFGVRFGPGQADHLGKKHLGKLVTEHEALREFTPLSGEQNFAAPLHFDVTVASHALNGGGNRGGSDVEFLGKAGTDGNLIFLVHLPNGFEVIFLRNASLIATQRNSEQFKN